MHSPDTNSGDDFRQLLIDYAHGMSIDTSEAAIAVGGFLVMAGAVNPDTSTVFGLDDSGEVDLLQPDLEAKRQLGLQAMTVVALSSMFGELPYESPNQVDDNKFVSDLSYNTQIFAQEWGADKAIQAVDARSVGIGLNERVDDFVNRHNKARSYTARGLRRMTSNLNKIIGVSGNFTKTPLPELEQDRSKISYHKDASSLLHLQEYGAVHCSTASSLASFVLRRCGLSSEEVLTLDHSYLAIPDNQGERVLYDGTFKGPRYSYRKFLKRARTQTSSSQNSLVSASTHNNFGNLLSGRGRKKEAEVHYKTALELNPDSANVHNNYGALPSDTGRKKEAEVHYKTALELNPDSANVHNSYGALLSDTGRKKEAEVHYKEALRLNPSFENARINLASLLRDEGRFEEALIIDNN